MLLYRTCYIIIPGRLTPENLPRARRQHEVPDMEHIPLDYSNRIKRLRGRLGLTQTQLAEILGVSFATVNRWENRQSRPSQLAWAQIEQVGSRGGDSEELCPQPKE